MGKGKLIRSFLDLRDYKSDRSEIRRFEKIIRKGFTIEKKEGNVFFLLFNSEADKMEFFMVMMNAIKMTGHESMVTWENECDLNSK